MTLELPSQSCIKVDLLLVKYPIEEIPRKQSDLQRMINPVEREVGSFYGFELQFVDDNKAIRLYSLSRQQS